MAQPAYWIERQIDLRETVQILATWLTTTAGSIVGKQIPISRFCLLA